jgi:hypothetical protein
VGRPYIIGTQCCNGRSGLEVYPRGLRRPNNPVPSTDLLTNGSLRLNGYLAVTASSMRESAFTDFHVMFWLTWTRYALLLAPQHQKSQLHIQGHQRPIDDLS